METRESLLQHGELISMLRNLSINPHELSTEELLSWKKLSDDQMQFDFSMRDPCQ